MKKEMEQKWTDLKGLKATISEYESHPRGGHEDDPSNSKAEGAMAITPVADNAPSVSTTPGSLTSPLGEEHTRTMEVDNIPMMVCLGVNEVLFGCSVNANTPVFPGSMRMLFLTVSGIKIC